MTLILFFILAIAIFGIMFVITIIKGITSFLFGKSNTFSGYGDRAESHKNHSYYDQTNQSSNSYSKKVFPKEEGEYVKFEEIKE